MTNKEKKYKINVTKDQLMQIAFGCHDRGIKWDSESKKLEENGDYEGSKRAKEICKEYQKMHTKFWNKYYKLSQEELQ